MAPIVVLVVASVAIGGAAIVHREPVVPEQRVTQRPIQIEEDGYASSRTCQACHPREYGAWHRSHHRTMTQLATPETVIPNFDGVQVDDLHARPTRLERRGNQFWAEFDDPDWDFTGTAPPRVTRQVVMSTGSHHQQMYWYPTGRSRMLGQLPVLYLISEGRWIPRRAAEMHPPERLVFIKQAGRNFGLMLNDGDESQAANGGGHRRTRFSQTGQWNSICILCHTTHGRPERSVAYQRPPGQSQVEPTQTEIADTRAAEFGIACEACHGPGEQHARLNRNPLRRYSFHLTRSPDPTTAQPARLRKPRSSEVCGQCHSIQAFYDRQGERQANSDGLPYRPGDELLKTRLVVQPSRNLDSPTMRATLGVDPHLIGDSFWSDGMVRVTGREYNGLIESPCFKRATQDERTLSCSSCHSMHKAPDDPRSLDTWADDQLTFGMDGNNACLQCHAPLRANLVAHTKHAAASEGSSCYNCHMPYTTYGLLKTIRSHQISNPSVAESLQTGRPNACNLCHVNRTLAWTSEWLQTWYGTPKPALTQDESSIAASLLWLLRGDAGQRAIVAQTMGWRPAQDASGAGWIAPHLAQLLKDPYAAVRFIAYRSMRTLPGLSTFAYDFLASPAQQRESAQKALETWRLAPSPAHPRHDAQLLFDPDGTVRMDVVTRLVRERNDRPVHLRE
jgi:hypothetical protein